jgi:hypothetical protein
MFRALIFSTVVAFVAAPHASQLCIAWCEDVEETSAGCHGDEDVGWTALQRADGCANLTFAAATLARDDSRPASGTSVAVSAVLPNRQVLNSHRRYALTGRPPRAGGSPRSTVLRL